MSDTRGSARAQLFIDPDEPTFQVRVIGVRVRGVTDAEIVVSEDERPKVRLTLDASEVEIEQERTED